MSTRRTLEPILGFEDRYGYDLRIFQFVAQSFRRSFQQYGYEEIETPIVERETTVGENVIRRRRELFFLDVKDYTGDNALLQSLATTYPDLESAEAGHSLLIGETKALLRPEGTAPVCRFLARKLLGGQLVLPLRVFFVGPMFRNEKLEDLTHADPTKRSFRQFYQADPELMGSPLPQADAEVIDLSLKGLQDVGLKHLNVRVSNVGLFLSLCQEANLADQTRDELKNVIDTISLERAKDNSEEINGLRERLEEILENHSIPEQLKQGFLALATIVGDKRVFPEAFSVFDHIPNCRAHLRFLQDTINYLEALGSQTYTVDLGVVRGLEIYTGVVFQVDAIDEPKSLEIAGGGRYDNLVKQFAENAGLPPKEIEQLDIPSTGFAYGMERVVDALLKRNVIKVTPSRADVIVHSSDPVKAMTEAARWRERGIRVEVDVMNRDLQQIVELATALSIPKVLDLDQGREIEV